MLALLLALLAQAALVRGTGRGLDFDLLLLGEGLLAAGIGHRFGLPRWWIPLQMLLLPTLVGATRLALPPLLWLGGFTLLLVLFWNSWRDRVPLYLSGPPAWEALARLVPAPQARLIDLGCGLGGALAFLGRRFPAAHCEGIESAPLVYVLAGLRLLGQRNVRVRFGSFWSLDLASYDLVFTYLSPQPMLALWLKAKAEMRPGTLFVSHSFPVPEVALSQRIEFESGGYLYVYRL